MGRRTLIFKTPTSKSVVIKCERTIPPGPVATWVLFAYYKAFDCV